MDDIEYSTKPVTLGDNILYTRIQQNPYDHESLAGLLMRRTNLTQTQILDLEQPEARQIYLEVVRHMSQAIVLSDLGKQLEGIIIL